MRDCRNGKSASRSLAPGNARPWHPGRKAAYRARLLPPDSQRPGLRLQSEDQPVAGHGGDGGRSPGGHRQPEEPQPGDRNERRSEEHTSELQSLAYLVCRLLLEKKKKKNKRESTIVKIRAMRAHREQ